MNMSQKLRFGTAAVIMIAACSDQGSTPVAPVARATTPFGVGAGNPADQGTVTIKRTIEVRDPDQTGVAVGAPPRLVRREKTISMGSGQVTIRDEDVRMKAALAAAPRQSATTIDDLPVAGLSFPAGTPSLTQSIRPWRRVAPLPDHPELSVEASGVGEAPASTIRYSKYGVTTLVVSQAWELSTRQWNLVRREMFTPDGSFHELVVVTRRGAQSPSSVESPREWARGAWRLGAGAPSFDVFSDDEEDCKPCKALEDAAADALASLYVTIVATGLICAFTPPAANILACWVAMTAVEQSYIKFNRAVETRNDCLSDPPAVSQEAAAHC